MMARGPFSAERLVLDPAGDATLTDMTLADAADLAPRVAAIEPWHGYGIDARALEHHFAVIEDGALRRCIRVSSQRAGALTVRSNWLRGPYIQMLVILPPFGNRGLGAAILEAVEGEARRVGDRNLWVAATSTNLGALRFYARHGFAIVAELDGLVEAAQTEVLLRKRLDERRG